MSLRALLESQQFVRRPSLSARRRAWQNGSSSLEIWRAMR